MALASASVPPVRTATRCPARSSNTAPCASKVSCKGLLVVSCMGSLCFRHRNQVIGQCIDRPVQVMIGTIDGDVEFVLNSDDQHESIDGIEGHAHSEQGGIFGNFVWLSL